VQEVSAASSRRSNLLCGLLPQDIGADLAGAVLAEVEGDVRVRWDGKLRPPQVSLPGLPTAPIAEVPYRHLFLRFWGPPCAVRLRKASSCVRRGIMPRRPRARGNLRQGGQSSAEPRKPCSCVPVRAVLCGCVGAVCVSRRAAGGRTRPCADAAAPVAEVPAERARNDAESSAADRGSSLAAGILFAEAHWAPLRKACRRLLEPLRGDARRRPRSRGVPVLAVAGAPPLEPVDTRPSPVVRSASRLNPFRRKKTKSGRGAPARQRGGAGSTEEPAHPAVVDRLAQYSLAAPDAAAPRVSDAPPPPEAAKEVPGAPSAPATLETLHARIRAQLERAAKTHLALSVVAVRLQPSADLAPDLSGVEAAVVTTARQVLGEDAEIAVVDSHDDTIWLILPGVLPKRSGAVAARLRTTLAPHGHVPAIAVAGYPADGKTSDALVERCLDEIARSPASEEVPTRTAVGPRSERPASD
jgi:hypothetical protein